MTILAIILVGLACVALAVGIVVLVDRANGRTDHAPALLQLGLVLVAAVLLLAGLIFAPVLALSPDLWPDTWPRG
jgi:hypothetical protein